MKTENEPNENASASGVDSSDLFGTSTWRASGWEEIRDTAKTGDRITGETKRRTVAGSLRVLSGTFEGSPFRAVYFLEDGEKSETSFEFIATICKTLRFQPNSAVQSQAKNERS